MSSAPCIAGQLAGVVGVEQLDVLLGVSLLVKVVLVRFIKCSNGFPLLYF